MSSPLLCPSKVSFSSPALPLFPAGAPSTVETLIFPIFSTLLRSQLSPMQVTFSFSFYQFCKMTWHCSVYNLILKFIHHLQVFISIQLIILLMLAWVEWGCEKTFAWAAWLFINIALVGVKVRIGLEELFYATSSKSFWLQLIWATNNIKCDCLLPKFTH